MPIVYAEKFELIFHFNSLKMGAKTEVLHLNCMCVCVYIYVCVRVYIYIYTHTHTHTHTHTRVITISGFHCATLLCIVGYSDQAEIISNDDKLEGYCKQIFCL